MPKSIPKCPGAVADCSTGFMIQKCTIRVITPMVGGGVEAGTNDPRFPIRGTSIRGHLRQWWRLTIGRDLNASEAMWQREEEVFGSTDFVSPLVVRVLNCSTLDQLDPTDRDVVDPFGPAAYALFASIENQHLVAREGIVFEMLLSWPGAGELNRRRSAINEQRLKAKKPLLPETVAPIDEDIRAALRAWIAFGGLGGRTRRGCGAVHANDPILGAAAARIDARIFTGQPTLNAVGAWAESVRLYREFRQTPRGARHRKTLHSGRIANVPGRSHWPEADSIRQITGCSLKPPNGTPPLGVLADVDTQDHSTPVVPVEVLPSFPKATLGLPINFHFADGPGKSSGTGLRPGAADKDPQDVQLVPLIKVGENAWEPAERMASPVITRPLWLNGKWHPAFIILASPELNTLRVRLVGERSMAGGGTVSRDIPHRQVADPSLGIITPMRGKASALEALMEFLTETAGFEEQQL